VEREGRQSAEDEEEDILEDYGLLCQAQEVVGVQIRADGWVR
jgi:hypothetical protein